MIAEGFLGTRADLLIDTIMIASGLIPLGMMFAIAFVSKGKIVWHKNLQILLLLLMTVVVMVLEVDIRLGDVTTRVHQSNYWGSAILAWVFGAHLFLALSTFFIWVWLVLKSSLRYPQPFEHFHHALWGRILFVDLVLTLITGWVVYLLLFAL